MTASVTGRRGQPLMVLVGLLVSWVGMRVVLWEPPFESLGERRFLAEPAVPERASATDPMTGSDGVEPAQEREDDTTRVPDRPLPTLDRPLPGRLPTLLPPPRLSTQSVADAWQAPLAAAAGAVSQAVASDALAPGHMAVGHAVLAMMGLSRLEVPAAVAAYLELARRPGQRSAFVGSGIPQAAREPAQPALADARAPALPRWTGDAWVLLRQDSAAPLVAGQQSYGRSQAGAVLRYRLAPSSRHAPQAYVRASAALQRPRDAEIAGGVSARPLAGVPLRLAAELRVSDTAAGTDLRPAAIAVTEFPPLDLPFGARGEAYVQGGYVGGDFATPFVDGQMRVTREVARIGNSGISAGAGAWGGAQKDASRLDIGPSAAVSFRLGEVNSRLAVDYRVRVAGDAEPESGPALTLSAGF